MEVVELVSSTVDDDANDGDDDYAIILDEHLPPLERRVIDVVKASSSPSSSGDDAAGFTTIRPAKLSAELGLSVDDACAELCGLLAAVGGGPGGATFTFESVTAKGGAAAAASSGSVMVFTFPPDFERRALRKRRQRDLWRAARAVLDVAYRALKIATAFGLILSLLILCVAAMVGMVAAMVALSRGGNQGGGHHHRNLLIRQLRTLFYTARQLLWCYALMGPDGGDDGQDPFLRETAYDISLICSLCCGNPMSAFYWIRAHQLSRRRRRVFEGWGGRTMMASDVEGVSLIRPGSWGEHEHDDNDRSAPSSRTHRTLPTVMGATEDSHRGLLSVTVEFLFGPVPFDPGPTDEDKWRLRAAVLVSLLSSPTTASAGVSLEELMPFADAPPALLHNTTCVIEQGLMVVAHFNGAPAAGDNNKNNMGKAKFVFPELMAESSTTTRYESPLDKHHDGDDVDQTWTGLLYRKDSTVENNRARSTMERPSYLTEPRYRLTRLSSKQFIHCVLCGGLNFLSVFWLDQSISPGGVIEVVPGSALFAFLHRGLIPILRFYAVLFFALPGGRLCLIAVFNALRKRRNHRRKMLAHDLHSPEQQ